jgi:cytochrome b involved in lipid metabolism
MKKNIIFLAVSFVLVTGITLMADGGSKKTDYVPAPLPENSAEYSLGQVSAHKDAQSCWTVVRGGVYDLTAWIGEHPGGQEAILSMCGVDATASFEAMHGGQRRPESELASFLIGKLTK